MQHEVPLDRLRGLGLGRGLVAAEVEARRSAFGRNEIVEVAESSWRALARDTARDPMLWFLVGTGGVYAALGQWTEALVLLASLAPIAGMDAFLHRRTQASTHGLRGALSTRARVLRGAGESTLASEDIVVGDLALVRAGESFPADGVLEEALHCQVDESALTGEAHPVRKAACENLSSPRLDAVHWGFAGTRVLGGSARLRVVNVGGETLYGSIVRSAALGAHGRTPLQVSIGNLVRGLVIAALILCAILAAVRWQQGYGWGDALLSALTLAIAAMPEEFPVVFSVFLGVGVHRLARRKALVRRAVSVENVGRVTTLCSDKTGTITAGVLELTHVLPAADSTRERVLETGTDAAQAETGDPLDVALLALAPSAGRASALERFPFTEDRKRETAVFDDGDARRVATKGSPETVLAMCTLDAVERARWTREVEELASGGHKVIACASQRLEARAWSGGEPDRGFHFEGLLAFEDPVRPGVRAAVAECARAGLRVIVVTGDHPGTARAIAREIGLTEGEPKIVLGEALEAELARSRERIDVDIVARAIPAQKLALVRALQAAGEIVAVTGDGVNDVPALQAADIGIAMGGRGTRSAREIASIVLLDDDFATIVGAISEGRQLFRNLQRSFEYLLMIHLPLVFTAAAIPLLGHPLLYLPIHVVWIELIIHPTALLVFQESAPRQPLEPVARRRAGAFFSRGEWFVIASVGALITLATGFAFEHSLGEGRNVEHARAMVLVVLCSASAVSAALLSRLRSVVSRWVVALTLASAVILVQVPVLARYLHLDPLHATDWGLALVLACVSCAPLSWSARRSFRRAA